MSSILSLKTALRVQEPCPEIVNQIKKHVPELREVLGTCVLKEKCDLPGLQGADAVSYSGYRQERGVTNQN